MWLLLLFSIEFYSGSLLISLLSFCISSSSLCLILSGLIVAEKRTSMCDLSDLLSHCTSSPRRCDWRMWVALLIGRSRRKLFFLHIAYQSSFLIRKDVYEFLVYWPLSIELSLFIGYVWKSISFLLLFSSYDLWCRLIRVNVVCIFLYSVASSSCDNFCSFLGIHRGVKSLYVCGVGLTGVLSVAW